MKSEFQINTIFENQENSIFTFLQQRIHAFQKQFIFSKMKNQIFKKHQQHSFNMNSFFKNNISDDLFSQNTVVSISELGQRSLNTISSELRQDITVSQINTFKNQFINNDLLVNMNNFKFQQLL